MALINCKECDHQISDKAATCPKCGAPALIETPISDPATTTTQLTSKGLKLQLAIYAAVFFLGLALTAVSSSQISYFMIFIGIAGYIYTKIRSWWHHS